MEPPSPSLPLAVLRRFRHALADLRGAFGRPLDRWLAGAGPASIISEDCWGGEFCRAIGRAYTTPLAGAFILPGDYLRFLENFRSPDAFDLTPAGNAEPYPVGRTPYATIHFQHAPTWEAAASAFARRAARLDRRRLFFKIDFGKAGYTQDDVERWNKLALPRAIALLPPGPRLGLDLSRVHRGWRMTKWTYDGAAMFHLSRRAFDFHAWIHTGELRACGWNRALNFLLWDRLAPAETIDRLGAVLGVSFAAREAAACPRHVRRTGAAPAR